MAETAGLCENQRAKAYIQALGGPDNLITVGACTTRLRLELADRSKAVDSELKALGAMGVMRPGRAGSLQVVVGPMADSIADDIRLQLTQVSHSPAASTVQATTVEPVQKIEPEHAQRWLTALGGSSNVLRVECVAITRLRVKLGEECLLSEMQLKALGSQGISQHADGVWHVLVGEQAGRLSEVLGQLIKPL